MIRNIFLSILCAIAIFLIAVVPHCAEAANIAGNRQDGYVGSETCMECHEDYYASYMKSRHGVKADPKTPAA